jgi:hypothetical protein
LDLKYLKSNICFTFPENNDVSYNPTYIIEFNIFYSEVYQTPTAYFTILNLDNNNLTTFEDFLKLLIKNSEKYLKYNFVSSGYEISKTVNFKLYYFYF